MQHHIVLKVAAKLILPFILLFALYVQFHGDFGPGGGFQAGVIFGAGIILYALVFGVDHARAVVALARRLSIDMPICEAVDAILHEGAAIDDEIRKLLSRPLGAEPG